MALFVVTLTMVPSILALQHLTLALFSINLASNPVFSDVLLLTLTSALLEQ